MKPTRYDIAAALGAVMLVWLFWIPMFHPSYITVSSDLTNLLWMQRLHFWRGLSEGVIPLWNPHIWGGAPFLASLQPAIFDPTTWIGFLRGGDPISMLLAFDIQRLAILGLLTLSTFALARWGFEIAPVGSLFAAALVGCSEHLWGHIDHVILLSALVWTPLMLLGGLLIARGGGRWPTLLIAICFALQIFAGHPQHAALGLMALAVVVGSTLILTAKPSGIWLRTAFLIAAGLALGAALSAVQLLPALELAGLSARQFETDSGLFSMRPVEFARLLFPSLAFSDLPAHRGETGLFISRVAVASAVVGLAVAVARWRNSTIRPLLSLGVLALFSGLWSLGENGPIFEPLLALLPPLQSFRVPPRMLFHFDLALALLAGFGLSWLLEKLAGRRVATLLIASAMILLAWLDLRHASAPAEFRHAAPIEALRLESPLTDIIAARPNSGRLWRLEITDGDLFLDPRPAAFEFRMQRLQPNLNVLWEIDETEGYVEGLLPTARWRDLLFHLNRNLRQSQPDAAALALLGVEWVIAETWVAPIEHPTLVPVAEVRPGEQVLTLHRNALALPRVLPLETLTSLAQAGALDGPWSRGEADMPRRGQRAVHVLRDGAEWPSPGSIPRYPWTQTTPNEILVLSPSDLAGEVALIQATYPGWRVHREGQPVLPIRVHSAVWSSWTMDPNESALLRFEPTTYRVGLFVSLIGALILALTLAGGSAGGIPSRRESPQPE